MTTEITNTKPAATPQEVIKNRRLTLQGRLSLINGLPCDQHVREYRSIERGRLENAVLSTPGSGKKIERFRGIQI